MHDFLVFFISMVVRFFDQVSLFVSSLSEVDYFLIVGGGIALAAGGVITHGTLLEGVLADAKKWHGSIAEKLSNVDNLVNVLDTAMPSWGVPADLLSRLKGERAEMQRLISKCLTKSASQNDRIDRDSQIKLTIDMCLNEVRLWAYGAFGAGLITADIVHKLGFLLPGEASRHRDRSEATDATAVATTRVISADVVRVVIDQADAKDAAKVVHGWPKGVKNALIVIADEHKKEVYRTITTRLHNDITMPEGSHGKLFYIMASFLKHVDDEPRFGPQPSFTMPYRTEDVVDLLDKQREEEAEQHRLEAEIRRLKG
jgi:hypothetical protein